MALEFTIDTLEGVDENIQSLYKAVDGKYQLDVTGAAPKAKVDDFRSNNIELTNKINTIETKLNGLDIEKFDQMFQSVQKMVQSDSDTEMQTALEQGTDAVNALIEKRAASRADAMKADFTTQLDESTRAANKFRSQLEDAKITAELTRIAAEKGVRSTAVDDVLLRGKQIFKLSDTGEVVAMKDGEIVYNKENQPQTINEYVNELAVSAPHLFEVSSGGGSDNDSRPSTSTNGSTFVYRGKEHNYQK